jgi:hypothetical protein
MTSTLMTGTVMRSTLAADSTKHAYFMWFSQSLKANTKYTMVIVSAMTATVT